MALGRIHGGVGGGVYNALGRSAARQAATAAASPISSCCRVSGTQSICGPTPDKSSCPTAAGASIITRCFNKPLLAIFWLFSGTLALSPTRWPTARWWRVSERQTGTHRASSSCPRHSTSTDYRIIIVLSLLLSLWLIAIDPVLNKDAILCLRSARSLPAGRRAGQPATTVRSAAAAHLFRPGASAYRNPLVYAGLLLTSVYYAILCVAFVATVATLGKPQGSNCSRRSWCYPILR